MAITTSLMLCTTAIFGQNVFPSSGNVGIGASSPNSLLHIIAPSNTSNAALEVFGVSTAVVNTQLRDLITIRSFQPNWTVSTEFVVRNNGNVGIGTATPTSKLQVVGDVNISGLSTLNSISVTSNSILNGNVGVGVANPLEKLDIAGNIKLNNNIIYLRGNYDYNHGLRWCGSSAPFASVTTIDGPVLFGWSGGMLGTTSGGQKAALRWNSAGQVMIGNQSPIGSYAGFKLAVDGDLIAKKCVVQIAQWSDDVFDENYKLAPLTEVEQFIKENKHLPEIPSENEVCSEGISLGDMNNLLLRKIEELTLHVIAQQKQIDELKKK